MTFISLPSVGTLAHDVGNFLTANPALIHEVAGHALAHVLYSHMRRGRSKRISRRQSRKLANRKRRWFVDNIIMHHKRLHDRNREMVITNARTRALARRKESEKERTQNTKTPLQQNRSPHSLLHNKIDLRSRGEEIRSMSRAKKMRAESRWASLVRGEQASNSSSNNS